MIDLVALRSSITPFTDQLDTLIDDQRVFTLDTLMEVLGKIKEILLRERSKFTVPSTSEEISEKWTAEERVVLACELLEWFSNLPYNNMSNLAMVFVQIDMNEEPEKDVNFQLKQLRWHLWAVIFLSSPKLQINRSQLFWFKRY